MVLCVDLRRFGADFMFGRETAEEFDDVWEGKSVDGKCVLFAGPDRSGPAMFIFIHRLSIAVLHERG